MKILFVGGGSLGPVTPLLATWYALRKQDAHLEAAWIGTPDGPERALVEAEKIPFFSLAVAKWPRYPSVGWLTFPYHWFRARTQAQHLLKRLKPDAIVTVGGYTAAPMVQVAAAKGIPCFTHQLDLEPGLTNRFIARQCASVSTSFEYAVRPFGEGVNDEPIPTPVRYQQLDLPTREQAAHVLGLNPHQSMILIYGGGQGALALNGLVERHLDRWLRFTQLIHVTGKGKSEHLQHKQRTGYVVRPFLDTEEMLVAHAAADLEILRGGIGGLSEIAALKKAALVIPMSDTHQEANARAFEERGAALIFDQTTTTFDEDVLTSAKLLLQDRAERVAMGERAHTFFPTDGGTAFAKRILSYLNSTV